MSRTPIVDAGFILDGKRHSLLGHFKQLFSHTGTQHCKVWSADGHFLRKGV